MSGFRDYARNDSTKTFTIVTLCTFTIVTLREVAGSRIHTNHHGE